MSDSDNSRQPLSVSSFLTQVQDLIDSGFAADLQIKGEVSSFNAYPSGHWYFTIKDKSTQLQCTMFKNSNASVLQQPKEGDALIVSGNPNIYKARGQLNFIVTSIVKEGVGDILLEFEKTKKKLQEEGLFDAINKKPIPSVIKHLCIITSSQTAALQDVIKVVSRRMPMMRLYLAPSLVQGAKAAEQLTEMVKLANTKSTFDAILITRGGGSPEDLHCFNDEGLARAIYESNLPVVSAVGHEVDFTICDLVADHRSPTPSAAAEELSIDSEQVISELDEDSKRLYSSLIYRANNYQQLTDDFWNRILRANPVGESLKELMQAQREVNYFLLDKIKHYNQGLDGLSGRLLRTNILGALQRGVAEFKSDLRHGMYLRLSKIKENLAGLIAIMQPHDPNVKFRASHSDLNQFRHALEHSMRGRLTKYEDDLGFVGQRAELSVKRGLANYASVPDNYRGILKALNPTAILTRGYALVAKANGELIRDAKQLKRGDLINLSLGQGSSTAEVVEPQRSGPVNQELDKRLDKPIDNPLDRDSLL
ncbi:MAG: exodeoxyribonuclease VII large subunit [Gammaproteobacteria bacterium]|nr:exodeoxyribonuclease VII large subunit [Gammaproteobacteria bacterium]